MKSKNTYEKTLVLSSGKCAWGKCVFCGWGRAESRVDVLKIKDSLDKALNQPCQHLKIFASGSLLDEHQFPIKILKYLARLVKQKGVDKLTIESRPEFITHDKLKIFEGTNLFVAIGLETSDDKLRKKLGKGFTRKDYLRAVKKVREHGFGVKTYLLVNPPHAENVEQELEESVDFALKHSDEVVLINTYPHANAPINDMWLGGEWKPLNRDEFLKAVNPYLDDKRISIDFSNFDFKPRFPENVREEIVGAGEEQLLHPHFEVWQDYLTRLYEPKKSNVLFVPCSYRKPYTKSRTWKAIKKVTKKYGDLHHVAISNPGVVPEEFANKYPFNSYDWPEKEETPEIKELYIKVNKERIKKYLDAHDYFKVFSYLKPSSESHQALEQACDDLDIKLHQCLTKDLDVRREEALRQLDEKLGEEL